MLGRSCERNFSEKGILKPGQACNRIGDALGKDKRTDRNEFFRNSSTAVFI